MQEEQEKEIIKMEMEEQRDSGVKNKNQDLIEMERKFLITGATARMLESDADGFPKMSFIQQYYLFEENAEIYYNSEKEQWIVILLNNDERTELIIPELKNPDEAEKLFPVSNVNIVGTKCAARIRLRDGKTIFTLKVPVKNGIGDYEFEHDIEEVMGEPLTLNYSFHRFLRDDEFKIIKERHTAINDKLTLEFDYFVNVNLNNVSKKVMTGFRTQKDVVLLEIEFDNAEEYLAYMPNFFNIEVTGMKEFGNKNMAYNLGKEYL